MNRKLYNSKTRTLYGKIFKLNPLIKYYEKFL